MQNRHSIRLRNYDYASHGAYFVTVCAYNQECLFGEIVGGEMVLNDVGKMVQKWWVKLENKYSTVVVDKYIVMPNHFHGIIMIVGADPCVCPSNRGGHMGPPLPTIVQWFKTMTTNEYIRGVKQNKWSPFNKRIWQRNYYEHIIRDEDDLNRIREYIIGNPAQWADDKNNPDIVGADLRVCPVGAGSKPAQNNRAGLEPAPMAKPWA